MKVHFKGWASKFDELIPISKEHFEDHIDQKFAEIGMYSEAYG